MKYRFTQEVYKTGSIKGTVIPDVEIKTKTYYYVRRKVNGEVKYLRICDGKYEFTDLPNATPLEQKKATKYVNLFRKKNVDTSIFSCSKDSF